MANNPKNKVRAHVFVSGRVQGVFFRDHTRKKAEELAITGWVANKPDGRVEAIFEGTKENVEKMLDWAKQGPDSANVDKLDIINEDYQGGFPDFKILA